MDNVMGDDRVKIIDFYAYSWVNFKETVWMFA